MDEGVGKKVKQEDKSLKAKSAKGSWHFVLPYINALLLTMILFIIVYKLNWQTNIKLIQGIMLGGVVLTIAGFAVYSMKKGFSWKLAVQIGIVIGFIMRIGYMLYTPLTVRSHDLGDITTDGYGHAAYILKLLVNHRLPESNWVQFYHPPLFHFLAACMCSLINGIMKYTYFEEVLEAAKIVSCVASLWCLMLMPKICNELKMSERAKVLATFIIAVFPDCFLIGARVNNDSLVIFFMMLAVLYTLKWFKDQSWFNTMVLGLAFGLGMMTKSSCGTIALFTGPIMLYIFIKRIREKNWVGIFGKLCSFAAIAFPLGLWYTIRNYILFDQPFGYVVDIGKESQIYTGDISVFERFIQFPVAKLMNPVYAYPWEDWNISMYVIKSSIFGEFVYDITEWIPKALVLINFGMILLSLFAMIYLVVKIKENVMLRFGMPLLWLLVYGSFLYFNYQYPYGCTMDYRYIVPTVFTGAIFIGTVFEHSCTSKSGKAVAYRVVSIGLLVLFALLSILMYCLIKA